MNRMCVALIAALAVSSACSMTANAQEVVRPLANAGQKAIFVSLGNQIPAPAGRMVGEYRVERRSPDGKPWSALTAVRSPSTDSGFISALRHAARVLSYLPAPPGGVDVEVWNRAKRFGRLDSLGYWGSLPSVQIALGAMMMDSAVSPTFPYEYRVTAIGINGKAERSVRTKAVRVPGLLLGLRFARGEATYDSGGISLRWQASGESAVSALLTFRQADGSGIFEQIPAPYGFQRAGDVTSAFVQDSSPGGHILLRYFCAPLDLFGNPGPPSDTVAVGLYDFPSASTVSDFRTERVDSALGIRLRWALAAPQFVKSVRVERATSWDGRYDRIAEVSPLEDGYLDQTVQPMQQYFYRLVATGLLGETSTPSARVYGVMQSTIPPVPPQQLVARDIGNGVKLEWRNTDDNIAGFYVYRSSASGDSLELFTSLIRPARGGGMFVDTARGLSGRRVYAYAVRSENTSHILSGFSDTVYARPRIPTRPVVPVNLSAAIDGSIARLYWEDMTKLDEDIAGYFVHRRGLPSGKVGPTQFRRLNDSLLSVNYFADTGLVVGKTYEYAVQAMDYYGGASALSGAVKVVVPALVPAAPAGLRGYGTPQGNNLQWDTPGTTGVTGYRIYRYERGKKPIRLADVKPDVREFLDRKSGTGHLYFYYLTSTGKGSVESRPSGEVGLRR